MPADAKRKEARKRKFGTQTTEPAPENSSSIGEPPKKRSKGIQSSQQGSEDNILTARDEGQAPRKAQRFIVFVGTYLSPELILVPLAYGQFLHLGNLPFTATDASIHKHFAKVHPKSIRHRTDKETGKSKGFAFLEFAGYDHMKTCLKLFHQSTFDDGETPPRKLNVELT